MEDYVTEEVSSSCFSAGEGRRIEALGMKRTGKSWH